MQEIFVWVQNSLWACIGILVIGLMRLGPKNLYLNTYLSQIVVIVQSFFSMNLVRSQENKPNFSCIYIHFIIQQINKIIILKMRIGGEEKKQQNSLPTPLLFKHEPQKINQPPLLHSKCRIWWKLNKHQNYNFILEIQLFMQIEK